MRILYVHAPGDPRSFGGIQTYGSELAQGMRDRGHEVHELAFDPAKVMAGDLDFSPRPPYWHPEFLWRRQYYQDFRYHQAVQREVAREARTFGPDIVHVLHLYQLGALQATNLPSVVTCHGLEINRGILVRRSLHRAGAVHCNSQFTAGYLRSLQPSAPRPRVLRWGIKSAVGASQPAPPESDLITVSRMVARKNVETVLQALRSRPELRYHVLGDGPEREALEARAREWGLSNVRFLGEVSEEVKWKALTSSRAFVLVPRRDLDQDVEGLGLVYFEAFAAHLPVLAARSGGVPEAVGVGGVVVEDPLDVHEVGSAIDALMEPDAQSRWEQAVKQRHDEDSWEFFLQRFEAFYGDTIATHPY
jgi:glycosyltransferase involved in cell wall biosynthesis